MRAIGGLLTCFVLLCLWVSQSPAAPQATLENFTLGMSVEEAAKVIELKRLTVYYENSEIPGRLSRAYKGNILGRDEGTLDLVFRDGRLILITATLKGITPELQQSITKKHQELDSACRMLYGGPAESPGPGITEWHLQEVVVSLYKGDDKIFITAFNREALSE